MLLNVGSRNNGESSSGHSLGGIQLPECLRRVSIVVEGCRRYEQSLQG
jgi:hypothetical protein